MKQFEKHAVCRNLHDGMEINDGEHLRSEKNDIKIRDEHVFLPPSFLGRLLMLFASGRLRLWLK